MSVPSTENDAGGDGFWEIVTVLLTLLLGIPRRCWMTVKDSASASLRPGSTCCCRTGGTGALSIGSTHFRALGAQIAVDLFHVVHLAVMVRLKIIEAAGFRNIEPAWHTGSATRHLCWAAGRSGAVRMVGFCGPLAEARLAAARGDTATAVGTLRRAADGGRRVAIVAFVPAALAALACMAAIAGDESTAAAAVGEARAELGGRRSWKSGAATC